jgi:UDP-N-acetylmuramoyl-L-alanyl-D-glutamate--2,6-diaminopimelate ligase
MMVESGLNTGLMTTVAYGVNDNIQPQVEHMTTVSVQLLHQRLKQMKTDGAEWVVLEVTSHALAQGRTWGIPFEVAVLTNLTHEHLDYHGTFERYRDAKRKLFKQANRNKNGLRSGIINAEDESAKVFASDIAKPITYGINQGDLQAKNLELTSSDSRYKAVIGRDEYQIVCHLPGSFNVSNSLAAVGVGHVIGLTGEQIEKGIAALKGVEGRMTTINEGQDFEVIVDYAHTPDSFEKLF